MANNDGVTPVEPNPSPGPQQSEKAELPAPSVDETVHLESQEGVPEGVTLQTILAVIVR